MPMAHPALIFPKPSSTLPLDQSSDGFLMSPPKLSFPSQILPAPLTGGPKDSYVAGDSLSSPNNPKTDCPPNTINI